MTVRRIRDNIDKWIGLSTDIKPSSDDVGSLFISEDTGDVDFRIDGEWVSLVSDGSIGGGGGGGNPFSEPVVITVDGSFAAPSIEMGDPSPGKLGFYTDSANWLINVAAPGDSSPVGFGGGNAIWIPLSYAVGWLTEDNFANFATSDTSIAMTSSVAGVLQIRGAAIPPTFRMYASGFQPGGDNSRLDIVTQAGSADFLIHPIAAGAGVLRGLQLVASGGRLGFYGTTAIAKPTITGSKGGNAAVASIIAQLVALGLVINGSSA